MGKYEHIAVLGITGGVGAGKSTVLEYLEKRYGARLIECDALAAQLQEQDGPCRDAMIALFGAEVLREDGHFNRPAIAAKVFADESLREALNAIVHPAVKAAVREALQQENAAAQACTQGARRLVVIEAALLLDDNYGEVCDEIWYVYAPEEARRRRLKESRGYSDERIDAVFASQRSEESFRALTQFTIDNSEEFVENTYGQIDEGLRTHGLLG